jgi:hypothetical protein
MRVGIDVDGVCDFVPGIIRSIVDDPRHEIHIITYRSGRKETEEFLKELDIRFDHLHMTEDCVRMEIWKKEIVIQNNIEVMIEDTPEILENLPPNVVRIWITDPEIYDMKKAINGMLSIK